MILECHECKAKVDAKVIAQHTCEENEEPPFITSLCECPRCHTTLVAGEYDMVDDTPTRVWPQPEKYFDPSIPEIIRTSLEEASVCFKAGAHSAATVMAGRALEGICRHFGSNQVSLGHGIRELREKGLIDGRLARWAKELQKARNLSAHASGEKVSREDAQDLLDFTSTICEYVFVLTAKFDRFMQRRASVPADSGLLDEPPRDELDEPESAD